MAISASALFGLAPSAFWLLLVTLVLVTLDYAVDAYVSYLFARIFTLLTAVVRIL
ncbi:hypothetical protein V8C40DRAFT_229858, partial [Trichoderma camerunense]